MYIDIRIFPSNVKHLYRQIGIMRPALALDEMLTGQLALLVPLDHTKLFSHVERDVIVSISGAQLAKSLASVRACLS